MSLRRRTSQISRRRLLGGASALAFVGCGLGNPPREPVGLHNLEDKVHGKNRRAKLIIPEGLTGPAPLLVGMHDSGGEPSDVYDGFGWRQICAERGWVGVFPTFPLDNENDDNAYLEHLIGRASALGGIDAGRIYVMGHGGGGRRAYAIGATRGDLVRAVGASGAVIRYLEDPLGPQDPKGPAISLIHIHGGQDLRVPVGGGPVKGGDGDTRSVPSVDEGLKPWIAWIDGQPVPSKATKGFDTQQWTGKGETVLRALDPRQDHAWSASYGPLMADFFSGLTARV